MQQKPDTIKSFPVMLCFQAGIKQCITHARPLFLMNLFPLAALSILIALKQILPDTSSPILGVISLLPAQFLLGVVSALVLRWFVLDEHPTIFAQKQNSLRGMGGRNQDIRDAAIITTAVSFIYLGGLTLLMLFLSPYIKIAQDGGELPSQVAAVILAAVGAMLYLARFFWLSIPVALGFDVKAFYTALGGFSGSLRVFLLFSLCSFLATMPFDFVRVLLLSNVPTETLTASPIFLILDSVLLAAGITAQTVLFTCASAAAIRAMLGKGV